MKAVSKTIPVVLTVEYVGASTVEAFQATAQSLVRRAQTLELSIKIVAHDAFGKPSSLIVHPDTESCSAWNAAKMIAEDSLGWE